MELTGSILLILAVAVVVVLFIIRPFLQGQRGAVPADGGGSAAQQERDHQLSALMAERDRMLLALQELDFDYGMGKVPEEDYPAQRAVLLKAGADTLRRLDALQSVGLGSSASTVEDRIEAAVAARRADASNSASPEAAQAAARGNGRHPDAVEDLIASRKRVRKESSAGFCPKCGKPVQKSDKFCPRCGAPV